jgi:hypothetical protein
MGLGLHLAPQDMDVSKLCALGVSPHSDIHPALTVGQQELLQGLQQGSDTEHTGFEGAGMLKHIGFTFYSKLISPRSLLLGSPLTAMSTQL